MWFLVACLVVAAEGKLYWRSRTAHAQELQFPREFQFGAATASYQIEGAWNSSGKGVNIWDTLTHEHPDLIADLSNADVACDSYHKYKQDVQILKQLGVNFYRFSISWSRILPNGFGNQINKDGIKYYNALIDELLANNIQPMVTIYHWDLPQSLQDLGGWANTGLVQYFEDYSRILFLYFGDRVKQWITFNEPLSFVGGYASKEIAPRVFLPGVGDYMAAHTVLLAHARIYHMYQQEFKKQQQGKIGITLNIEWCEPLTNSTADVEACERRLQFALGLYAHPIFSTLGDYPDVVKKRVEINSKQEGYPRSRLPAFTRKEVLYIRGTYDFFGLNFYTAYQGKNGETGHIPSMEHDAGVMLGQDPSWPTSASSWLKVVPWAFRKILNWVAKQYNNPTVIVTESGYSDLGEINDTARIDYYSGYLTELLKAIHEDGCKVAGYTAWSLLDNFEWNRGYTERFGLYHVDFRDPARRRTPKKSAQFYHDVIKTRSIPNEHEKPVTPNHNDDHNQSQEGKRDDDHSKHYDLY